MQIVIDIPEERYEHIMRMQFYIPGSRGSKSLVEEMLTTVRNGTPLPEGAEILTKEAYSDLCMRAADVTVTNVGYMDCIKDSTTDSSTTDSDSTTDSTTVKPEKCGDCISRQAAIDKLNKEYHGMLSDESMKIYQIKDWLSTLPSVEPESNVDLTDNRTPIEEYTDCVRRKDVLWITKETGALETQARVVKLPSVEPERKLGKWIWEDGNIPYCSNCKKYSDDADEQEIRGEVKFCSHCGSLMEDTDVEI